MTANRLQPKFAVSATSRSSVCDEQRGALRRTLRDDVLAAKAVSTPTLEDCNVAAYAIAAAKGPRSGGCRGHAGSHGRNRELALRNDLEIKGTDV